LEKLTSKKLTLTSTSSSDNAPYRITDSVSVRSLFSFYFVS